MFRYLLAFVLPVLLGYNLLSLAVSRSLKDRLGIRFLILSAGPGVGLGVTSVLYFLSLVRGLTFRNFALVEIGLLFGILLARAILLVRRTGTPSRELWKWNIQSPALFLLFLLLLTLACFRFYSITLTDPIGGWDAFAQWNLKALFLYRGADHWEDIFRLEAFHAPNYPLLLPGAVARGWSYWGGEDPVVSQIVAFLFCLSVVGTLVSSVSLFRSPKEGWLAGAVLCSVTDFPFLAALQLADVPIGLYLLCGIVFLAIGVTSLNSDPRSFVLSGFFLSLAVWTKDEGWLMIYSLFFARIVVALFSTPRAATLIELGAFVCGAFPIAALAVLYHQYALVMAENPLPVEVLARWNQMLDPSRWWKVISLCLTKPSSLNGFVIPAFILFLFIRGRRFGERETPAVLIAGLTLSLIVLGYLVVYLNCSHELSSYIAGNGWRLVMQLVPLSIFLGILVAYDPPTAVLDR